MIVVVGGIKGGSGKTTLATNLAAIRAMEGSKILFIDADEQKSATDWAAQRASNEEAGNTVTTIQLSGKGIYTQVSRMKEDYDDIIIDVGGRDTTSQRSALTIADVLVVPFKPRSLDIWTLGSLKTLIHEIKAVNPELACLAVVNQADSRGSDNEDAIEILKECSEIQCLDHAIGYRKAFGNAASDGLSVVEMKDKDKKAVEEIRKLHDHIYVTCFASRI